MTAQKNNPLAWLILCLLALIWGSSFILVKKGLLVFSPLQVAAIRVSTGFLCLLVFALPNMHKIPSEKWKYIFISGFTGIFIPAFMFAFAQIGLDSSLTAVLNSLTPLFTVLFGVALFNQQTKSTQWLGILIALVGTVGLVLLSSKNGKVGFNFYAIFVLVSTITYGFNVNLTKTYLQGIPPLHLTAVSLLSIGPFALFAVWFTDVIGTVQNVKGSGQALSYLMLLGASATAFAMILFNRLLQIAQPVMASSVTYLIPVVAIVWGILDGEVLRVSHFICIAIVLLGVWWVNK